MNARTAVIDLGIYSREAAVLAAAAFQRQAKFSFQARGPLLKVTLRPLPDAAGLPRGTDLLGEYLNEVLGQDLRLSLVKQNSRILQLLSAQAFSSAHGAGHAARPRTREKHHRNPGGTK